MRIYFSAKTMRGYFDQRLLPRASLNRGTKGTGQYITNTLSLTSQATRSRPSQDSRGRTLHHFFALIIVRCFFEEPTLTGLKGLCATAALLLGHSLPLSTVFSRHSTRLSQWLEQAHCRRRQLEDEGRLLVRPWSQ